MLRVVLITSLCVVFLSACSKTENDLQIPQFVSKHEGNFILHNGRATMTVSPTIGGRVISLTLDRFEFLIKKTTVNEKINSFGSVLWSSPQSEWGWPPLPELDSQPYSVGCNKDHSAIIFSSVIEPKTGYQFVKSYSIGVRPETFKMRYKIINNSDKAKNVAAIENTRVNPRGFAFFPKGSTEPNSGIFYPLNIQIMDDIVWHKFEPEKIQQDHHKVMMDGKEGWLAYNQGQYLFVQRSKDVEVDQIAESEREIEIFGHLDHTFAEIKHQSALHLLQPGESFEWEVEWEVKKLGDDLNVRIGSEDLVNAARSRN